MTDYVYRVTRQKTGEPVIMSKKRLTSIRAAIRYAPYSRWPNCITKVERAAVEAWEDVTDKEKE